MHLDISYIFLCIYINMPKEHSKQRKINSRKTVATGVIPVKGLQLQLQLQNASRGGEKIDSNMYHNADVEDSASVHK